MYNRDAVRLVPLVPQVRPKRPDAPGAPAHLSGEQPQTSGPLARTLGPPATEAPAAAAPRPGCPLLGCAADPAYRFARPTRSHACFALPRPAPVSTPRQQALCLTDRFPACPRFARFGAAGGAPEAARPAAGGARPGAPCPVVVLPPAVSSASALERVVALRAAGYPLEPDVRAAWEAAVRAHRAAYGRQPAYRPPPAWDDIGPLE